jgi:hypothetical protein
MFVLPNVVLNMVFLITILMARVAQWLKEQHKI